MGVSVCIYVSFYPLYTVCVFMFVHLCMCQSAYVCMCVCICVCMCVSVCHVCMCMGVFVSVHGFIRDCLPGNFDTSHLQSKYRTSAIQQNTLHYFHF